VKIFPLLEVLSPRNIPYLKKLRADKKHLESFEMWSCRRLEKISLTDRVRNDVMYRVKEERKMYIQKGRLTRLIISCLMNLVLKERTGRGEKEDISNYWITPRQRENTGN
jgi:hypothetical protein